MEIKLVDSVKNEGLQLVGIKIYENYRSKWNIRMNDFCCLFLNRVLVRPTLYRVGGLSFGNFLEKDYFMLLKYTEAFYSKEIMAGSKDKKPKHLKGQWCILDKHGVEKKTFPEFSNPYLVKNSCIYSVNRNYYNIETDEFYCHSSLSMESKDYLFLDNEYGKDETKRGVMKINKKTGDFELFK